MLTKKNLFRMVTSIICCFIIILSFCMNTFAIECSNVIDSVNEYDCMEDFKNIQVVNNEISDYPVQTSNYILANFAGVYYGWIDVPFKVTDSTRTVKVTYSVRSLNGSSMITYAGIRKSDRTLWFWTKNNQSGNKQIFEVGKLEEGDYVLRIKTNQTGSGYSISGQVYYF